MSFASSQSGGEFYNAVTVECGPDKYVPKDGGPVQYKLLIECEVQLPGGPTALQYRGDLDGEYVEKTFKAASAAGIDTSSDDPFEWSMKPGRSVRVLVKEGKRGNYIAGIFENAGSKPRELSQDDRDVLRRQIAATRGRSAPAVAAPKASQGFAADQTDDDIPF